MSTSSASPPARLSIRSRLAVGVGRAVAGASRLVHFGTGSVIGGRASLLIDRNLLRKLTAHRDVVIVSATNGKTTTTRMLSVALETTGPVVSNSLGANMTPGIIAALGSTALTEPAVLEVDERWVGSVLDATGAQTVLLLNLSRDQLDRSQEVRKLAQHWKSAISGALPSCVIANADDPLVVWAAAGAPHVMWVATGQDWTSDAAGCPACSGRIEFERSSWHCTGCDLQRPDPDIIWDDSSITIDDRPIGLELGLPGRVNRSNAAFAIAAASRLGAEPEAAARAVETVTEVAGRYRVARLNGVSFRLLLAKNPAGWHEALEHLAPSPAPLIVAINARIADGHDPSWLWDVDFERLGDRFVVALGERRHDLAVRLHYADVEHVIAETLDEALSLVADSPHHDPQRAVDIASNYTAFQEYLDRVGGPE